MGLRSQGSPKQGDPTNRVNQSQAAEERDTDFGEQGAPVVSKVLSKKVAAVKQLKEIYQTIGFLTYGQPTKKRSAPNFGCRHVR